MTGMATPPESTKYSLHHRLAAHARKPFDAVDGNRRHERNAAGLRVAHRMKDWARMGGAAKEVGQRQNDELRRPDRFP